MVSFLDIVLNIFVNAVYVSYFFIVENYITVIFEKQGELGNLNKVLFYL